MAFLLLAIGIVGAKFPAIAHASYADDVVIHEVEDVEDRRLPSFVSRQLTQQFDHFVYHRPSQKGKEEIPFRLLRARPHKDIEDTYPLLVWLHGAGESGDDNVSHLRWLDLVVEADGKSSPFFILAVQCPQKSVSWSTADTSLGVHTDRITITLEIVDQLLRDMPIDANRIYVSGVSSGGSACWEMMLRRPEVFAAAVPLASGGASGALLERLKNIPVWVFHNVNDTTAPVSQVRQSVSRLQELGGKVALTETVGDPELNYHNCWTAAFRDYGVRDWLLAQQKDATNAPDPGQVLFSIRWENIRRNYLNWDDLWPRLLVVTAVLVLVGLICREMGRRVDRAGGARPEAPSSPPAE